MNNEGERGVKLLATAIKARLAQRLVETAAVQEGAQDIDIVITRAQALMGEA